MAVIELKDVSKLYGFGNATTLALDEINLTIESSEFMAVMGPSGSGKTTLMNLIGLLDKPTNGSYTLDGRYVSRLRPNQQARLRRDRIGFVFQSYNLLPRLNVLENVALPLAYKGLPPMKRLRIASDILELVGLRDREYYYPRQLSGGQVQRAAIARALINRQSIIIADEPTGNLDSHDSKVVMELFAEVHRQGNTIMLVTHNPELTRYANRVIYMYDGTIVGDEKTAIGTVAKRAKYTYFRRYQRTDEEVAAGEALLEEVQKDKRAPSKKHKGAWRKKSRRKRKAGKNA